MQKNAFDNERTVSDWDRDYYPPAATGYYDAVFKRMLGTMDLPTGSTVLDAGCGPGVHSIRVAKAGHQVCAVDISDVMLRHARQRVEKAGLLNQVSFQVEDLRNLSFPDAWFDYAFSWGVIIHIKECEKAFQELARVIRPGGMLGLYLNSAQGWEHHLEGLLRAVVNKKLKTVKRTSIGRGTQFLMNDGELWLWQFHMSRLIEFMSDLGFDLKLRCIGELSELQRHVKGPLQAGFVRMNSLMFKARLPAAIGRTNLLVLQKRA